MKRRRALVWTTILLLVFLGLPVWLVQRQIRQERLASALTVAIRHNQPERTLALLQQGANPVHCCTDQEPDTDQVTEPVTIWERLRMAFRFRASSGEDICQYPAIHAAIIYSSDPESHSQWYRIIEIMLECGVDPNLPGRSGITPLMQAAYVGKKTVAELLLEYGADIHRRSEAGYTALIIAAHNDADTVALLLQKGAKVDDADTRGDTPLHGATEAQLIDRKEMRRIVEVLLLHGARNMPDKSGLTPIDLARQNQLPEIVQLIREAERKKP